MEGGSKHLFTAYLSEEEILSFGQEVTSDISCFSIKILHKLSSISNDDAIKVLSLLSQ